SFYLIYVWLFPLNPKWFFQLNANSDKVQSLTLPALYQDYFSQELGLDALMEANPEDEDMLREMQELLVDTVCSHRKMIRIAGDDKPYEVVKGQLMKLNSDHIRFVLMCLKENTTQVRNMRQYLLA